MKEKAPGKTLLQVVGIILVVIGVLALLVSLINIAVLGMAGSGEVGEIMEQSLATTGVTMADYKASVYIMTAGALINLVIGIIGIANCNKIQKAGICFVCGIILIVWQLGTNVYSAVTSGITGMGIINIIIGLILPLLYFWGALKNRQAMLDGKAQ